MLCSCFSPLLWVSKKISTSQNIRAYHILNNWKKCLYADKTNWYQGRLLVELLNWTLIYRDTTNAAPDFMIIFTTTDYLHISNSNIRHNVSFMNSNLFNTNLFAIRL